MMSDLSIRKSDLAMDGGVPVRAKALPPWPHHAQDEIDAVVAVLRSGKVNYWTGEEGRRFEEDFARATGTRHAIALANGTVALELALYALGIGPGDEVITTSRTFIASASCAVARGATPVIADVDPISQNITAETVRAVLSPRTRAIVAVHLAGWPCDMDSILEIAAEHGIEVIEDCAQAHGATYKGRPVGGFGHAAAFSFCQDKIMTTGGEGGMLVTNDEQTWARAWAYKDHGKSFEAVYHRTHPPGFKWLHESFGTNWRMTDMQSAIGRLQLRKLQDWVARRRENAAILNEGLRETPGVRLTLPPPEIGHAYYKFYLFLDLASLKSGWSQGRIIEAVNAEGIPCYSGSCGEIYLEGAFRNSGLGPATRLPNSRLLAETSLMLLVHPTLSEADMQDACAAVDKVMRRAAARR
jgi:dTDP-4-amino-4,6-dideoxygalactose transaminase